MKFNIVKNIRTKILLTMTGLLLLASCYKDLGTYEASEINMVTIAFPEAEYDVFPGDTLRVSPVLSYSMDNSGDTSRYSYKWYSYKQNSAWYDGGYYTELSFERDLSFKMTQGFGVYDLFLLITDKVTKAEFRQQALYEVLSNSLSGWMILSGVASGSRLDMVSFKDEVDTTILDVLAFRNSPLHLSGTPIDIWKNDEYNNVYVSTTGNGTAYLDPISLNWPPSGLLKYNIIGSVVPDDYYAEEIFYRGYYKDGNVYSDIVGGYNFPVNRIKTEADNFVASKFIAYTPSWYGGMYLYDETNKRFVLNRGAQPASITLADGTLFPFNNTGKTLVFMRFSGYNGGEVFFVSKDLVTNKYFLGRFQASTGEDQRYYQEITTAPNIALAENFAVSTNWGYVFYTVDGKLYEFDLGLKTTKLMMDYSPAVITKIAPGEDVFIDNDKLVISSYNPGSPATSGTLEVFEVPGLNANLVKKESYTGFGKIVDFLRKN